MAQRSLASLCVPLRPEMPYDPPEKRKDQEDIAIGMDRAMETSFTCDRWRLQQTAVRRRSAHRRKSGYQRLRRGPFAPPFGGLLGTGLLTAPSALLTHVSPCGLSTPKQ